MLGYSLPKPGFYGISALMKQYVIDELRFADYEKIKPYLDDKLGAAGIGNIYWIEVEDHLLTPLQQSHNACRPFFFGLELEPDRLCCELLVRSRSQVRCDCFGYATKEQFSWLVDTIDAMLASLEIQI